MKRVSLISVWHSHERERVLAQDHKRVVSDKGVLPDSVDDLILTQETSVILGQEPGALQRTWAGALHPRRSVAGTQMQYPRSMTNPSTIGPAAAILAYPHIPQSVLIGKEEDSKR
jgi:hypothetical protein